MVREDLSADGVLLLDKPAGITSTRALAIAKRALRARKAGHTGTLDPFATGLLPLVFGEATKFSRFLIDAGKTYEAIVRLGIETATGDPEGPVIATSSARPDKAKIAEVLLTFVGVRSQIPPMHSALHVAGKRLYEYAREGVDVERPAREIEVKDLVYRCLDADRLLLSLTCTKGTYIRVLAQDIGKALGCGATLEALRRTAVGDFRIEDSIPLEEVQRQGSAASSRLLPIEVLVGGLARWNATHPDAVRFAHGQPIGADAVDGGEVAVFDPAGGFLGVGRSQSGRIEPLRLMASRDTRQIP